MPIREMSREECLQVLARRRLARLACASENRPYIVPVYLVYHSSPMGGSYLYGFATPGQKVEWLRANSSVCIEVDEVAADDQWVSVVVSGHYEELPATPEVDEARLRAQERPLRVSVEPRIGDRPETPGCADEHFQAWQILQTYPMYWEPASTAWAARAHDGSDEPFQSIFYRVRIEQVTGREATPNASKALSIAAPAPPGRWAWLFKPFKRVFGGR